MRVTRPPSMGSSPHGRGAVVLQLGPQAGGGAIPARTRSRCSPAPYPLTWRGHPHTRGKQQRRGCLKGNHAGLIPACRGAEHSWALTVDGAGVIPACAESRPISKSTQCRVQDHPHVRGTVGLLVYEPRGVGAIPPCTGSRPRRRGARCRAWDHPRGREEQVFPLARASCTCGPSPPCGGAGEPHEHRRDRVGSIPAHAGSREEYERLGGSRRDHPRVRRKQHARHVVADPATGAIPAYAGNRHGERET